MSCKDDDNGDLSKIYEPIDIMYDSDRTIKDTFVIDIENRRIILPLTPWVSTEETVIIEIEPSDW